jgi:hypothetical protein
MELLNHLVAANLMKNAQRFERIGLHGANRRLEKRTLDRALAEVDFAAAERPTRPVAGQQTTNQKSTNQKSAHQKPASQKAGGHKTACQQTACQQGVKNVDRPLQPMVGTTGIEPVTPTMSR